MENIFFYLALAALLVHEMDAVKSKEWRMLPGLSKLKDETGYIVFTGLHLPLYFLVFWLLQKPETSSTIILILDAFFIVHLLLHIILRNAPKNNFSGIFSIALIWIIGISGLLDLINYFI
jgi:hypothetical protein